MNLIRNGLSNEYGTIQVMIMLNLYVSFISKPTKHIHRWQRRWIRLVLFSTSDQCLTCGHGLFNFITSHENNTF